MNGKIQIRDTGPIRTSARDLMALAAGGRRLEVLLALSEGECAASALAARLSMRLPHVLQSLAPLITFGLVVGRHVRGHRIYQLTGSASVIHRDGQLVMTLAGTDHTRVMIELHDEQGEAEVDAVLDYVRGMGAFRPPVPQTDSRDSRLAASGMARSALWGSEQGE